MTNRNKKAVEKAKLEINLDLANITTNVMMEGLRTSYGGQVMVAAILNAFLDMMKLATQDNDKETIILIMQSLAADLNEIGIIATFELKPKEIKEVKEE